MRIVRSLLAPVLAVALAVVPQAGGAHADQQIVGGTPVSTTDHSYAVYITDRTGFQFCGGTLVTADKVVTAAHCMARRTPEELRVVAGRDDKLTRFGTVVPVARIWVNQEFAGVQFGSDVAVLTLGARVGYRPAVLAGPNFPYQPGMLATILGWGRTSETGITSRHLLAAVVPVISDFDCAAAYTRFAAPSMVCAGLPRGGVDSCQGDSGGPMMVGNTLIGIASWGEGCARAGRPGVYTRVSSYAKLIGDQL